MNHPSNDTIKQAWKEEYQRKGIPSSFRSDPAKVVVEFLTWLKTQKIEGQRAADIGCGRGRNSFYLASQGFHVIGLELLEENVSHINDRAARQRLPVQAFAQDVSSNWPIATASLDVAIDIFCYKHIVTKEKQANYRRELWSALKPEGFYFISLASEADGFYGPLLETSANPSSKLIHDPYANISSFLYSMDSLREEFSDLFDLEQISEQTSTSPMYGQEYPRKVLNAIFKKRMP